MTVNRLLPKYLTNRPSYRLVSYIIRQQFDAVASRVETPSRNLVKMM